MLWRVSGPIRTRSRPPGFTCLANLRWRTGHLPDRAGCMKLNSTGIKSSPEKTVSVSALGPGPRPIIVTSFRLQVFPISRDERGNVLEGKASVIHLGDGSDRNEVPPVSPTVRILLKSLFSL